MKKIIHKKCKNNLNEQRTDTKKMLYGKNVANSMIFLKNFGKKKGKRITLNINSELRMYYKLMSFFFKISLFSFIFYISFLLVTIYRKGKEL